ncbi:hypothetical protein [Acinetobacter sp. WCHAc060025]|uniref:hypothetical protein n=1 Tax=Acinetobacter sp. WCHAc060025 TaxID=2518625 RepID=UPI001023B585|nr:hypothetical protein [Acinetobacter sp. WCHAc060025]RZG75423.1 50S ribosomal protein L7/L12 [Acinetobacter sp. WCHAc060025]
MPQFSPQQRQEIFSLLQQNRKVEAVKWVKEHSDLGLKESKDWVEQLIENPNFDDSDSYHLDSGNLDFEPDETLYPLHSSTYKALQSQYDTGEIYIFYQDGRKELIDEDHPEWDAIMDQFAHGEHFETADEFLDAMEVRNEEIFHRDYQSDTTNTSQNQHSYSRPTSTQTQPVGIEDQSKKSGLSRLVMIIVIVIIAVMAYQFIGKS